MSPRWLQKGPRQVRGHLKEPDEAMKSPQGPLRCLEDASQGAQDRPRKVSRPILKLLGAGSLKGGGGLCQKRISVIRSKLS